jgi:hypothetical protein
MAVSHQTNQQVKGMTDKGKDRAYIGRMVNLQDRRLDDLQVQGLETIFLIWKKGMASVVPKAPPVV